MKYVRKAAFSAVDGTLLAQIDAAAGRLASKLARVDIAEAGLSEYSQRYLRIKLANLTGSLQLCAHLLALSLGGRNLQLGTSTFIDYGGGTGVLSLLAKELGIGRVIYNDIYDVSCRDAHTLMLMIGCHVDDYICGDIDELLAYVEKESVLASVVCSYDVIEHIYDIEGFLRKLRFLAHRDLRIVFGSGANEKNPIIRHMLRRGQVQVEREDRERMLGHKERDTLKGYLNARMEIVEACFPECPREVLGKLARATRGLMKHDIEKCVVEYKTTGQMAYQAAHSTNTCDPYTGNWAEHLMDPEWLATILRDEGFDTRVLCGYWKPGQRMHGKAIRRMLNAGIDYLGKLALHIAPYYVICADHRS